MGGNLYGNTWQGGSGGGGTVHKLSQSSGNWTLTTLYSVSGSGFAIGRVVMDSSGNLYEALHEGGAFKTVTSSNSLRRMAVGFSPTCTILAAPTGRIPLA
jgi:uncharacterized repeat protein (TIGR03803 family)